MTTSSSSSSSVVSERVMMADGRNCSQLSWHVYCSLTLTLYTFMGHVVMCRWMTQRWRQAAAAVAVSSVNVSWWLMAGTALSWSNTKAGCTNGPTTSRAIRSDGSCCRMDICPTTGFSLLHYTAAVLGFSLTLPVAEFMFWLEKRLTLVTSAAHKFTVALAENKQQSTIESLIISWVRLRS